MKIGLNNVLRRILATVQYVLCLAAHGMHVSRWITEARELKYSGMMGENTTHWWLSDASNKNTAILAKQKVAVYSLNKNYELEKWE